MKKLLLGNVITLEEENMYAKAIVINDGLIEYVGNKEEALKHIDCETKTLDFGDNYIYPGFLESHCHGIFAGYRAIGQADLSGIRIVDYDVYAKIMSDFIKDHPNNEYYMAAGWTEDGTVLDHTYLDKICDNKPLIMNTMGGHSCLLNKIALQTYGINKEFVDKYGQDRVHVDENGLPTGYICEEAAVYLLNVLSPNYEEAKEYILKWQDIALSKGLTAVGDAGADLICKDAFNAYADLQKENKLKMRTYSYSIVKDNIDDPKQAIEKIIEQKKAYDGEYFKTIGAKAFLDGVAEARTSWTVDEFDDQKGYYGVSRFNDENKMVELISEASKHNLSVHVHSEGDGATKYMLECIKKSQAITNDYDQRNVLAHLHFVKDEDLDNMAKTNSIAAVPPLWTPKFPGAYEQEVKSFGQRAENAYPIKSFVDKGARIVYHTDYPISPIIDVPMSLYRAQMRDVEDPKFGGPLKTQRNPKECLTDRLESLKAMTINVAYQFKQEDRMGTIANNKIANFTVYDKDFISVNIEDITKAKLLYTIVDGEIVYENR